MHQMGLFGRIATLAEYVVFRTPRVFGIVVAEVDQRIMAQLPVRQRADADENVDDRLCPYSGDRG